MLNSPKVGYINVATVNLNLATKALKREIDETPRSRLTDEKIRQLREVTGDINASIRKLEKVVAGTVDTVGSP